MSKTVIIKSVNNQQLTITASDNATVQQILGSTEVLTFFGRGSSEIAAAFSDLNGQPVNPAFAQYVLQAAPSNNDIIGINLSVSTFDAAGAPAAPRALPGTVTVKFNGGTYSVDVSGIQVGVATVSSVIGNPLVSIRFGLNNTQLSSCDISLQRAGGEAERLTSAQASQRTVNNGDVIWLQSRAADDKGC